MFTNPNLIPIVPEMVLAGVAMLVLMLDLFLGKKIKHIAFIASQLGLLAVFYLLYQQVGVDTTVTLSGHFMIDQMSTVLKLSIILVSFFVFLYSNDYINQHNYGLGEYYVLALFSILGMLILCSASSLLSVYLGLELLSLPIYALVALNRDTLESPEAAMKYFIMGGLASAMLLYGMSLLYGMTGSLLHEQIFQTINGLSAEYMIVIGLAIVFIMVGVGFKFGAAPFHMWVPDIYQGAPTPVALLIGSAPKIAAFAMLIQLFTVALAQMMEQWSLFLMMLAVLSITLGNIIAIAQTNIKRLLAYSAISHVGFILLGVLVGTEEGYSAAMFYVMVYALTSAAAFGMIILMSKQGIDVQRLDDFKGLNARSPWYAFLMLIVVFSMAGVPPMVGFYAKFSVLYAMVASGYIYLPLFAVLMSVVAAFYYLRIVKLMYFDSPENPAKLEVGPGYAAAISINSLAILALGIFPNALMALCFSVL